VICEEKGLSLFKYMSTEVAPLFVETLQVRFTQPSDLNDPFEFRPLIDFEATAQKLREVIDVKLTEMFGTADGALTMMEKQQASDPNPGLSIAINVFRKLIRDNPALEKQFTTAMQRNKTEVLQSLTKAFVWEATWEQFQRSVGQLVGIFSLTEDPVHMLMWSHYASQHYGIVVEFDEKHSWFHQKLGPPDELRNLVQVSYIQNPFPRTWQQLDGAYLLYTKNAEWAYEREWRIIRPVKDGKEVSTGKFCFDVPPDAIRSLVFGCRTPSALEQHIRTAVAKNPKLSHVAFKRISLVGGGKLEVTDAT
jgi:hypothetical protein